MYITDLTESAKTLQDFYEQLTAQPNRIPRITIYHSDIYYIRVHLEQKFDRTFTAKKVYRMLWEEGMLKRKHIQPEDIDEWTSYMEIHYVNES